MKQKKHIFLLVVTLFTSVISFASTILEQKAEKAYANKNYKEAIAIYEQFAKGGFQSYKLYYNLGNAYYKNNQLGKAIYNYELAKKLQPNNEDIKTNLRIANEKKIDDIECKENFFLGAIKSGLVSVLTTTGWAWLSIASCIIFLILTFSFIASNKVSVKRLSFFGGVIFLIVFVSSMALGFMALRNKTQINFAIITSREVKIFEEPNTGSTSKFSLHEGTKVKVLDVYDKWTNIKLENGNEGWVKTADVGLF